MYYNYQRKIRGKSNLLFILSIDIYIPTKIEEKKVKEDIGVVLDDGFLSEYLSPKDINKIMRNFYKNWDEKLFFKYMEDFKLPIEKMSKEYSSGMKMKLKIATALSHHPKFLILDDTNFCKELMKGSTTLLILNLLDKENLYGYQLIKKLEWNNIQEKIIYGELTYSEFNSNITYKDILTEERKLQELNDYLFTYTKAIKGGTACPFTATLILRTEKGKEIELQLATDSCTIFRIGEQYYEYTEDKGEDDPDEADFYKYFDKIESYINGEKLYKVATETQLNVIFNNKNLWYKDTEFEKYSYADAWDKSFYEKCYIAETFPTEVDKDDNGIVYYVRNGGSDKDIPYDHKEYVEWRMQYIPDDNLKITVPYINLTEENINNI